MNPISTNLLSVNIESVHTQDAQQLIADLSRELARRYDEDASEGAGHFSPSDMDVPGAFFVVARWDGVPVGCGAIRPFDADTQAGLSEPTAEVKRMFVQPSHRGKGISRRILACLETAALNYGYRSLILETGTRNPEAVNLYQQSGFGPCECWGDYLTNSWSLCYSKPL